MKIYKRDMKCNYMECTKGLKNKWNTKKKCGKTWLTLYIYVYLIFFLFGIMFHLHFHTWRSIFFFYAFTLCNVQNYCMFRLETKKIYINFKFMQMNAHIIILNMYVLYVHLCIFIILKQRELCSVEIENITQAMFSSCFMFGFNTKTIA